MVELMATKKPGDTCIRTSVTQVMVRKLLFWLLFLLFFFLLGARHFDVAEGVAAVEFADVDADGDPFDSAFLGVLPEGVADGGGAAAVFGDEDVVLGVFLAAEVLLVAVLAGVNHGFDAVFLLHQLEQLVDTLHVEAVGVFALDVEDGDEVELFFLDDLADIGHLLVGRGLGAVDVVEAGKESRLAGLGDVGLVVGVAHRGTLGGLDIDELDIDVAVGGHLGPVDGALEAGDVEILWLKMSSLRWSTLP